MRKSALLAILLCLAILFSACGQAAVVKKHDAEPIEPTAEELPQEEMTQEQLAAAIHETELQMVAAALDSEDNYRTISNSGRIAQFAHLADLDADGQTELIYGENALKFDLQDGENVHVSSIYTNKDLSATYSQSGVTFIVDKDGTFYQKTALGEFFNETVDGKTIEYSGSAYRYIPYGDIPAIKVIECVGSCEGQETGPYKKVIIGEEELSWEDGQKRMAEMGLQEVTTTAADFTTVTYDAIYTDSLLQGLDAHFREEYTNYQGMFTGDIDGDGKDETLLLVENYMATWLDPYFANDINMEIGAWLVESLLRRDVNRSAFVLADPEDDTLQLKVYCHQGELLGASGSLTYEDHFLVCGNARCYVPTLNQDIHSYSSGITATLSGYGYRNSFMKLTDLADIGGNELLCIAQREADSAWILFVYAIRDGIPQVIFMTDLGNNSSFLIDHNGKPALLIYSQQMQNYGTYRTSYSYKLLRFDTNGAETELDSHSVSYTKDQQDGTEAAAFFAKLQPYLQKLTVLYDPFELTGQQWLTPEASDQGTPPANPEPETQEEEAQLGFVQVASEKSWLHLRTGPGINYDKVLTNPDDPDSFVRQALGSPVTILETIETDDPENPVWVKIRITYQGTEIIGYSSKTYIRMAE